MAGKAVVRLQCHVCETASRSSEPVVTDDSSLEKRCRSGPYEVSFGSAMPPRAGVGEQHGDSRLDLERGRGGSFLALIPGHLSLVIENPASLDFASS